MSSEEAGTSLSGISKDVALILHSSLSQCRTGSAGSQGFILFFSFLIDL